MDHAAVSERDHRLMMRLLWAYPNTGHLYSVIIGFLTHRRKNKPSFHFTIWSSRVPWIFLGASLARLGPPGLAQPLGVMGARPCVGEEAPVPLRWFAVAAQGLLKQTQRCSPHALIGQSTPAGRR
jgi:hypothetical protein